MTTVQIPGPEKQVSKGVDPELWRWMKSQAVLDGQTIGQKLNEILAAAKAQADQS